MTRSERVGAYIGLALAECVVANLLGWAFGWTLGQVLAVVFALGFLVNMCGEVRR